MLWKRLPQMLSWHNITLWSNVQCTCHNWPQPKAHSHASYKVAGGEIGHRVNSDKQKQAPGGFYSSFSSGLLSCSVCFIFSFAIFVIITLKKYFQFKFVQNAFKLLKAVLASLFSCLNPVYLQASHTALYLPLCYRIPAAIAPSCTSHKRRGRQ